MVWNVSATWQRSRCIGFEECVVNNFKRHDKVQFLFVSAIEMPMSAIANVSDRQGQHVGMVDILKGETHWFAPLVPGYARGFRLEQHATRS